MLKLYNTLTRKKETFKPVKKGELKIYSCGPTVYNFQQIGNMRAALFADFVKRAFRFLNYKIIDVVNITDVGHLVSDEDQGEDKMLKASKRENKDPYEIAKFYEEQYVQDLKRLNIKLPKYMPRATDHIKEQIEIIKKLEQKGFTYKTSDGIYYDVSKLKDYGKLSGQSLEQKKAGARVKVDSEKRNPQDFALWKFLTGDNKNHIMKWKSPWGEGFPGWHIECSAMGRKYLGDSFDIHTGGIDHIPVHHENEIAQNEGSNVIKNITFWMHNAFLLTDGEKMSKSLGNVYIIEDLINKGYSPLAFRELCLRAHYRKQMNFTFESMDSAQTNLKKINDFYSDLKARKPSTKSSGVAKLVTKHLKSFEEALKDDVNTPIALAQVYEFMNNVNRHEELSKDDIKQAIDFMEKTDQVLALLEKQEKIPKQIVELAKQRLKARENKDFNKADDLRNKIKAEGFEVKDDKDSKQGFIITKI